MDAYRNNSGAVSRAVMAAVLAMLVGIGLSRFAYSPLIPAIIEAGWFSQSEAAYLAAANFAGYLIGALGAKRMSAQTSARAALRLLMLVATLAFVASAFPLSFAWYFLWRLLSGIAGGGLMVLAATTVLPQVSAKRRGLSSGLIFCGVGLGIVLSGTLVPYLISQGLPITWFALAALSFAATAISWFCWPATIVKPPALYATPSSAMELQQPGLLAIYTSYGLIALGLVPHMVFLADYVARGLEQGIVVGARYWTLFGTGALFSPLITGWLADRFGFSASLRGVLLVSAISAGLLVVDQSAIALAISSLLVGSAVSGAVPLVLGQTQERIVSPAAQKAAWSVATATFALGQAGGGYAYSYLFASTVGNFELLFLLGALALFLALLTNLFVAPPSQPGRVAARNDGRPRS